MKLPKVLFLDIDGVLNHRDGLTKEIGEKIINHLNPRTK